ncbi:DUF6036 family nucleotidyltransferase [Arthrobacter sp. I2-34]|uniref:DUF6036 family nucleotidyltransferase n=1 Tax=Arthrobacter hankyongi TaxID=2904801 RepID=A0ABS9L791_9MICC|nr:DUF6036 family nucleotidyltransferase [Arthrobacter hankyongi]MCG2622538.1 DUF6036 family nucleotidyltransferase [Arthrobacter hankyongi]
MNAVRRTSYDAQQVKDLLRELARRLLGRDVAADIYLVGGAAIALEYSSRRSTADIDATYQPEQTVNDVAREMTTDLGLDPKWLNSSAKAWLPNGTDLEATTVLIAENLTLRVASPRFLLAMKLAAGRDRDIHDIAVLCRALGIQSAEEAVDIAFELYGEESMQLGNRDDLLLVAQEALGTPV